MTLNEYQNQAITTKIYDDSVAIPYVVLGIAGEAAELYEKVMDYQKGKDVSLDLLGKEIADVVWYLAAWCEENGETLGAVAINDLDRIDLFPNFEDLLEQLIVFSGGIAEVTKKALRDDFEQVSKGQFPADKLSKANKLVSKLYWTCDDLASRIGIDMQGLLIQNIEKLASRAERGVLGGSGDNR